MFAFYAFQKSAHRHSQTQEAGILSIQKKNGMAGHTWMISFGVVDKRLESHNEQWVNSVSDNWHQPEMLRAEQAGMRWCKIGATAPRTTPLGKHDGRHQG